jgi:hypothetical protein
VRFTRTALIPSTTRDGQKLSELAKPETWKKQPIDGQHQIDLTTWTSKTSDGQKNMAVPKTEKIIFPLDEALGIDRLPFKISPAAMLEIAYWVQAVPSFEAAGKALRRGTPIKVGDDTIRFVADCVGSLVFLIDSAKADLAWDKFQAAQLRFPDKKKPGVFYIEADGAMLNTRRQPGDKEGKRDPGKGKAQAPGNDAGREDDKDAGDKETARSSWMENKLGMVFSSDNFIHWKNKKGEMVHTIGKREYTAYLGPAENFKKHLLAVALRNGYGNYEENVLLSDGATWIRNMKEELFCDAQQILDFFHLAENVTNFAKSIFDLDESKYKTWSKNMCDLLKESRYNEVLEEINGLGTKLLSKSKFNLHNYIMTNKDNIDYATYKARGWYIGSGAIESGNKTVLQQRLKQAGMIWNKESAQYIVTLMAKAKSSLWVSDVIEPIGRCFCDESSFELLSQRPFH